MIRRIAWAGLMAAIAIVTAFAQLDRTSRFAPDLAANVPAPFRGFAQQRLSEASILAGDAQKSLDRSRDLLRVRPIPAEHLALLARAELLAGDEAAAIEALQAAGMRGWREPVSQRAMAEAALVSANYDVAAQRIAALLATGSLNAGEAEGLVKRLAQTAQGRAALARAMAAGGHWQVNFFRRVPAYLEPAEFADLAFLARSNGADLSCDVLDSTAARFEQQGDADLAQLFWPGDCLAD